jgi:alpha-beta hydrolase superfamily lysophospholipase
MTAAIEDRIERADAPSLFYRAWPPSAEARGVVVIVPGFNSHSGYYAWVAGELSASGLAVFAVDLRGRGRSDGERYYVETFDDYVADVAAVVAIAQARQPGLPLFLLGHSAGGVVACLFALDHGDQLTGLISESFAHELPAPDFALAVIKGISHIAPHAAVLRLKNADFSRDAEVVAAMDADPLIAGEAQPSETLAALVRADERLKPAFADITLPILILHGTEDKAAKPSGSQHFYDRAGSADKTLKLYPGSFHDPLNDLDKGIVLRDVQGWIEAHLARGTSSDG